MPMCKHHYLSGDRKGKRCRQTAKYPVRSPVVCQYHRKFQTKHKGARRRRKQTPLPQTGAGLWSAIFGTSETSTKEIQTKKEIKAKPSEIKAVTNAVKKISSKSVKKIKPLTPVLDPVLTAALKRALDSVLRRVFQLIRIGGSTGGVVASLGLGGDTIVDIILLLLPVAKLGVDVAWAAQNPIAKKLVTIDFDGGPQAVEAKTDKILKQLNQDANSKQALKELCVQFEGILGSVSSTFGQIVTAFIPDDFGLAGTAGEEIIMTAGSASYPLLRAFYEKMPKISRELLEDKKNLAKFINTVLDLLIKKDEKWWQRLARGGLRSGAMSAATLAGLGIAVGSTVLFPPALPIVIAVGAGAQAGNLLFTAGIGDDTTRKLVDEILRPRIPMSAEVISRSMALAFVTLRVLASC